MHRTYVGPTSARCRQTPADIPPSSRYRPDVGMFAGFSNWSLNIKWNSIIKLINQNCVEHRSLVYYVSVGIRFDKIMSRMNVF